jgi:hypothetical protein
MSGALPCGLERCEFGVFGSVNGAALLAGYAALDKTSPAGIIQCSIKVGRANRHIGRDGRWRLYCGGLSRARLAKVGPDTVCVIWTQLLACDLSASGFFNGKTVLGGDIPAPEPVRYCGLDNTDLIGESFLTSDDGNCFV